MTPRMTPRHNAVATPRPSRWISIGVFTMVFQFLALIFFVGQFFERQTAIAEAMHTVQAQHEQMMADLAVLKSGQADQDRRLDRIENAEAGEMHPEMRPH